LDLSTVRKLSDGAIIGIVPSSRRRSLQIVSNKLIKGIFVSISKCGL